MKVKNWSKFQHFKDRKPPWVKLYRDLLDDLDWHMLDGDSAKYLTMLWLIASEDMGNLPTTAKLAFRLRISEKEMIKVLGKLGHWIDTSDIKAISPKHQGDTPETEAYKEEEETEKRKSNVEQARLVFSHWQTVHRHPRSKLDLKRQKAIISRIKDGYSVDDLMLAVDGCRISPFHQGENSGSTIYDDIELICREAGNVDKFIKIAAESDKTGLSAAGRRTQSSIEKVLGGSHAMAQ